MNKFRFRELFLPGRQALWGLGMSLIFLLAFLPKQTWAQNKGNVVQTIENEQGKNDTTKTKTKKVNILNTDLLHQLVIDGRDVRKLLGNVEIQQNDMILTCDSAYTWPDSNDIFALGRVHIKQGDSLDIWSDSLKYFGQKKTATLIRNVRLVRGDMNMITERLDYDIEASRASYYSGAVLTNKDTKVTSRVGYYYEKSQIAYFKDSVVVKDPSYDLFADTLKYSVRHNTSYFFGPTNIITDSNKVYCEDGWYNAKKNIAFFKKNASLENPPQTIKADSIYFEKATGLGKAYHHITWIDTVDKVIINGNFAEYERKTGTLLARDSAMLTNIVDGDSLHIASDTLYAFIDTSVKNTILRIDTQMKDTVLVMDTVWKTDTLTFRKLLAYHHVKIYKSNMQGLCDSLTYSYQDSIIRFMYDPILWVDSSQMTADTIYMTFKNEKIDKLYMRESSFIVNYMDTLLYNQIRGKYITGFFEQDTLKRMLVDGSGESLYYADDDSGAYLGANQATCSKMNILFKDQKVNQIKFLSQPKATFHPMQNINPQTLRLKGFQWLEDKRPKSKMDLFTAPPPPVETPTDEDAPKTEDKTSPLPGDPEDPPGQNATPGGQRP